MVDGDEQEYPNMVFGAVIATAELVDCVRVESLREPLASSDHANGPWCWILSNVQRMPPLARRGAQGLWDFIL